MKSYLVVLHGGKHCPAFLRKLRKSQRKDFAITKDKSAKVSEVDIKQIFRKIIFLVC